MSNHQQNGQLNSQQQLLAEQLFCVKTSYKALNGLYGIESENVAAPPVLFNDIFQLIQGNRQQDFIDKIPNIINEINNKLALRKTYSQLLERFKFAESGMQAAASSGEVLPARITEQFSLKFKRDKTYPSQVFALLSILDPAEYHQVNDIAVHIKHNELVACVFFPALNDGCSQLLLEDNEQRFKLLTDSQSLLYLM